MALENRLKSSSVEHAGFDEMQQARLVFRTTCLESDGSKVFGAEDSRRQVINIQLDRFCQSLLHQDTGGRQELNWPPAMTT